MDAIESRLEECMWLGGQQPSSLDAEQLQAIGSEVPNVDTHPNAYAWYSFASKFSDAAKASWPKSSEVSFLLIILTPQSPLKKSSA